MKLTRFSLFQQWRRWWGRPARKEEFSPYRHRFLYPSRSLNRELRLDVYLPPSYFPASTRRYPVLLFNDGQDLEAVSLEATLRRLYSAGRIEELIAVGLHADEQRLQEYGTAGWPDYRNRGAKAARHTRFVLRELLPFLERNYRARVPYAYAGFSLGGLSAFDVVWKHPEYFRIAGIFSGSFWWRYRAFQEEDPDAHRIAHETVRRGSFRPGLRFWFQTGTHDETSDRNGNGIIDSIDDTLDMIRELERLGYRQGEHLAYVEIPGGEHNQQTWGQAMPLFLEWAFPASPPNSA